MARVIILYPVSLMCPKQLKALLLCSHCHQNTLGMSRQNFKPEQTTGLELAKDRQTWSGPLMALEICPNTSVVSINFMVPTLTLKIRAHALAWPVRTGWGPPWILWFFSVSTSVLMCTSFGWKVSWRWMELVCHWMWLFQNRFLERGQPAVHGLPGLLRKRPVIARFHRGVKAWEGLCFMWCSVKHAGQKVTAPAVLWWITHF